MGALHRGHLSLIEASRAGCDETIVTIFINPLQFGPTEDFRQYPRNEEIDLKLAREHGATAAYCPTVDAMYYPDRSVYVIEDTLREVLCGRSRPTHFTGVTTVVAKLFNACLPDKAYFGRKDYQQLLIIRRMVRDLDFPLEVVDCPIIREPDGLAMSSRNMYLDDNERQDALSPKQALDAARTAFEKGERNARAIENIARSVIEKAETARIDYIECRDAENLSEMTEIDRPVVLALAVFIGSTRLIDNMILYPVKEG
jgi:pantoate--beta-alanine ligase